MEAPMDNFGEQLNDVFRRFQQATSQNYIFRMCAQHLFAEFPSRLPPDLQQHINDALNEVAEKMQTRSDGYSRIDMDPTAYKNELSLAMTELVISRIYLGEKNFKADYYYFVEGQYLVSLFSQVDAFLSDTLRIVLRIHPGRLKTNRQIEWKDIIAAGDWDSLIQKLTESYILGFSHKSLPDRIAEFEKMGIAFDRDEEIKDVLGYGENVRHIVVHNGGIVSEAFIEKTARKDVTVGEQLSLHHEDLLAFWRAAQSLGGDVFRGVATKFCGMDSKDLFGFHQPSNEEEFWAGSSSTE